LKRAGAQIVVDEETQIGHLLAHQISTFIQSGPETTLACRLAGVPEMQPEDRKKPQTNR
jgi:hypothetical protein